MSLTAVVAAQPPGRHVVALLVARAADRGVPGRPVRAHLDVLPAADPRLQRRRLRRAALGRLRARADGRGRRGGRAARPGLHVGRRCTSR